MTAEQLSQIVRQAVREEVAKLGHAEGPEVLTREQTAELLQVTPDIVTKYIRENELPATKLGSEYRFRRSELLQWMSARHHQPKKGQAA